MWVFYEVKMKGVLGRGTGREWVSEGGLIMKYTFLLTLGVFSFGACFGGRWTPRICFWGAVELHISFPNFPPRFPFSFPFPLHLSFLLVYISTHQTYRDEYHNVYTNKIVTLASVHHFIFFSPIDFFNSEPKQELY